MKKNQKIARTNIIVGLGNPSQEYSGTRHNIGRDIVSSFASQFDFPDFEYNKKINAKITTGKIGKEKVTVILPDTYMNKSGLALKKFVTSEKKAAQMIVVHDDLDLGIGSMKIVFGRGSGGHRGIESVTRAIKTKNFARIKAGISPASASGKLKKPHGDAEVTRHVLGRFGKNEELALKKVRKSILQALETAVSDGYMRAMNRFN